MKMRCVSCRSAELVPGTIDHQEEVAGVTYKALLPAWVCARCDEALVSDEALALFERRMTEAVARGPVGGGALRLMRRWLGFKATELAALMGIRAETLSRWERDKAPTDANVFGLLARIVLEDLEGRSETLDYLKARGTERGALVDLGQIGSLSG